MSLIPVGKTLKPTKLNAVDFQKPAFQGVVIKNQPEQSLYTPAIRSRHWFESGDPLRILMSITAYVNFGNRVGFGLNEKAVNWNTVHWSIERGSPLFWF